MEVPSISVIIPLYNAKEYIGKCLDSLLAQTFQNFEVIIVDDRSIDRFNKVIKQYKDKFGEKLKLTKLEKNSGGSGYVPRNVGLSLASGEYVFFLDAEDFLEENALKNLYTAAKEYDVEVIYTAAYYDMSSSEKFQILRDSQVANESKDGIEEPVALMNDEPAKNLNRLFSEENFRTAWTKFVRRDFLNKNEITFPEIIIGGDYLWSMNIYCHAKKILRLTVPVYFRRSYYTGSISRKPRKAEDKISFWVSAFVAWLKALNELSSENDLLRKDSAQYFKISSDYFKYCLSRISNEVLNRFYSEETYEILLRAFEKENESSALTVPFFFSAITGSEKLVAKTQKDINKLENEIAQQQQKLDSATTQIKSDKAKFDAAVYQLHSATTQLNDTTNQLNSTKAQLKNAKAKLDLIKAQLESTTAKLDSTTAQFDSTKAQLKNAKTTLDLTKAQLDSATAQLESMTTKGCPAVSIIIPMYNAEQYIGEALDSILAQTLQSFEVIIVDDCSTDNSYKVVENYIPKFDGRLKLLSMSKNSGHPGIPRNKGIAVSRGEYIYCLDSDDTLTKTALEEMYTLAKDYDADVVYCEKYYWSEGVGEEFIKNVRPAKKRVQKPPFVDKPTLETNDIAERISKWLKTNYWMHSALRLVQRDLLIDNNIKFPPLIGSEDDVWFLEVLFCSKRFLRVPNSCFIRRIHEGGISFKEHTTSYLVQRWMDILIRGLKELDNFMKNIKFFEEFPNLRYVVLNKLSLRKFEMLYKSCKDLKPFELYTIFLDKFGEYLGEQDILVSFLCTHIFEQDKILKDNSQKINQAVIQKTPKHIIKCENAIKQKPVNEIPPAVSVVISLYNYENYIGECLDSILVQSFQDFEVIVVDDCSTDNSVKVVENYETKFNGRLLLTQTETNSGGGGEPRNIGLSLSLGEYVFFMDADDVITKTALEEMYTLAKDYDADVVYCEKYFMSSGTGKDFLKNIHIAEDRIQKPPFVDKPTFETNDMIERTKKAVNYNLWMTPWLRLVQRNLLLDNNITFDSLIASNDVSWAFKVFFCSQKFLRVPNICYIRRIHDKSNSFRERTTAEYVHKWMDLPVRGLKNMDNFMGGVEFFKNNLKCRYDILAALLQMGLTPSYKKCKKLTKSAVYDIFRENFGDYLGTNDVLVSCLYARIFEQGALCDNKYKKLEQKYQMRIEELEKEIRLLKHKEFGIIRNTSNLNFESPEVSVIVPMYNAEKYIGELLESLLIQTFQNFEVIVVDDCSTDSSVQIVESYIPNFNGLLKLVKTENNSNTAGSVPRNLGLTLSRGEYIYFADADDVLLGSSLETFYTAAKKFDADVVYTSAYYLLYRPDEIRLMRDGLGTKLFEDGLEDKPTMIIDNPDKILQDLVFERGFNFPWTQFVRRELLIENKITFPEIFNGVDHLWVIQVYCYSKRFLRISSPLYFYRRHNVDSISMKNREPREQVSYWISAFVTWLNALNNISNNIEILKKHSDYCLEATKRHFEWCLKRTRKAREKLSDQEIYEILHSEFSKSKISSDLTVPFFFSFINLEMKANKESL